MKKSGIAVLSLAVALALSGCGGSSSTESTTDAATTAAQPSVPTAATTPATEVPDVVGMQGDVAQKTLEDAGFEVEFDGGDKGVWNPANWTVDSQAPAGTATEGATIVLKVSKPDETTTEPASDEPTATSGGIDSAYAMAVCEKYADGQFPFGVDFHWITGLLADELDADRDEWFLKVEADVTNQYGAVQSGVNIECYVGGTPEAATVTEFNAY